MKRKGRGGRITEQEWAAAGAMYRQLTKGFAEDEFHGTTGFFPPSTIADLAEPYGVTEEEWIDAVSQAWEEGAGRLMWEEVEAELQQRIAKHKETDNGNPD